MEERRLCSSLTPSHVFISFSYTTPVKKAVGIFYDVSLPYLHVYKVLLSSSRNTIAKYSCLLLKTSCLSNNCLSVALRPVFQNHICLWLKPKAGLDPVSVSSAKTHERKEVKVYFVRE